MDKIELVVTHQADGPVGRHWSAIFGMAGGTVGRAGQNKLVLPDDDAMVARVHAMVRLDSDQAYIANLCERRSMLVDGVEVLSGQEVPLAPGADIGIGPYQLRAVLPGEQPNSIPARRATPGTAPASVPPSTAPTGAMAHSAAVLPPATSAAAAPVAITATAPVTSLDLASLPNPWADIQPIVGGEPYVPDLMLASLPEAPRAPAAIDASDSNPFAMLGRVETSPALAAFSESHAYAPPTSPAPAAPPALAVAPAPALPPTPTTPGPTPTPIPAADQVAQPLSAAAPAEPAQHNPFDQPASASRRAAPAAPAVHRAMVIPDDFDPFAADPKELASRQDPWSGDLVAKSLAEVAQLKNDELLQALPRTAQFAGEMDNAAHTGLPQKLDPTIELNPLKLFREPGEAMFVEKDDHGMSRGSDLAQVFNMPRDAQQRASAAAAAAAPTATAFAAAPGAPSILGDTAQLTPPPAESVAQAGLHAMQGLDLGLFGGGSLEALAPADLLDIPALQPPPDAPAAATTAVTPIAPHLRGANDTAAIFPSSIPVAPATQISAAPLSLPEQWNVPDTPLSTSAMHAAADPIPASQDFGTPFATPAPFTAPPAVAAMAVAPLHAVVPPSPAHAPAASATASAAPAPAVAATPAVAASAAPAPAELDALAAAFLEGAALEPGKVNISITPDFMRSFGEALRIAVQGSIDLLSARSEIKREFRADVTIIASGANNPLKFLPTAEGVLLQLAGQTFPGFMKPVPAMKEAYTDLAVHQIALMAGIRAAYAEAVAQLSPAELEKDAAVATGLLSKISSVHRKAALWDDFQQRYDAIRSHAEDDLMAFSGKTFVDAYEAAAQAAGGHL